MATAEPKTPDSKEPPSAANRPTRWIVPAVILLIAAGTVILITTDWNKWTGDGASQETDDAYLRADLTPLSTKVAGLVAKVAVADYQAVKSGDLLVELRSDDFEAEVQQAEAAVVAAADAMVNNRREMQLQESHIAQADDGIRAAEAEMAAAQAGIDAANASIAGARGGIDAVQADVERTGKERHRQEALSAAESTTRQKLEQAVADDERLRSQLVSRNADLTTASAQLASRKADLLRAQANVKSSQSALEAQKRQRDVLDSQQLVLGADLNLKKAGLAYARTNLGYTKIAAPEDGVVSERLVRPGQLVSPGTQVISLVQNETWVQANYKETQLRRIRAGDPAEIHVDAIPGVTFRGKVDQVAPASGSQFALLPPDNATGNFTKVIQRVPVKIVLNPGQATSGRLRPGLSVIAVVRSTGARQ